MRSEKQGEKMNYKEIERALGMCETFKHGESMKATREQGLYRVFSYQTEIARFNEIEGVWYVNPHKYSSTTSKQQNIVKRVIANLDHNYELLNA
jgi:hypothetical protein